MHTLSKNVMAQALQKPYDLGTFPLFLGRHVQSQRGASSIKGKVVKNG